MRAACVVAMVGTVPEMLLGHLCTGCRANEYYQYLLGRMDTGIPLLVFSGPNIFPSRDPCPLNSWEILTAAVNIKPREALVSRLIMGISRVTIWGYMGY